MAKVANGSAVAQFYYRVGSDVVGPVAPGEIRRLAAAGTIGPDTLVRKAEGKWVAAKNVQGLSFAAASAKPTPASRLAKIEPPARAAMPQPAARPAVPPPPAEPEAFEQEPESYEPEALPEAPFDVDSLLPPPAGSDGASTGGGAFDEPPLPFDAFPPIGSDPPARNGDGAPRAAPKPRVDIEKRYAALRFYALLYRIAGLLCIALGVLWLLAAAVAVAFGKLPLLEGVAACLLIAFLVALPALACYAIAHAITLAIDVEENTRASRLYLAQLYARSP